MTRSVKLEKPFRALLRCAGFSQIAMIKGNDIWRWNFSNTAGLLNMGFDAFLKVLLDMFSYFLLS